ncbi:hypothetical protein [uncultured Friedmanniella sp.]
MKKYLLAKPVEAVQYRRNENEMEIAGLIKQTGRRISHSNTSGRASHIQ